MFIAFLFDIGGNSIKDPLASKLKLWQIRHFGCFSEHVKVHFWSIFFTCYHILFLFISYKSFSILRVILYLQPFRDLFRVMFNIKNATFQNSCTNRNIFSSWKDKWNLYFHAVFESVDAPRHNRKQINYWWYSSCHT